MPRRSWALLSRGPDPQIPRVVLRDQELFGASGRVDNIQGMSGNMINMISDAHGLS